jgi:transcriptional accessory protein Tex/SPT6
MEGNNQTSMESKRPAKSASQDALKNQKWMDEFSSYSGEETEAKHANGEENFASLFEASQKERGMKEGEVVDGKVVNVSNDAVTVDIGFKCEGLVPIQEFKDATGTAQVAVGDTISVYIERLEIENSYILCSKDKAEIIKAWDEIAHACAKKTSSSKEP